MASSSPSTPRTPVMMSPPPPPVSGYPEFDNSARMVHSDVPSMPPVTEEQPLATLMYPEPASVPPNEPNMLPYVVKSPEMIADTPPVVSQVLPLQYVIVPGGNVAGRHLVVVPAGPPAVPRLVVKRNPVPSWLEIFIVMSVVTIYAGEMIFWVEYDKLVSLNDLKKLSYLQIATVLSITLPNYTGGVLMIIGLIVLVVGSTFAIVKYNVIASREGKGVLALFIGICAFKLNEWIYTSWNKDAVKKVDVTIVEIYNNFVIYFVSVVLIAITVVYGSMVWGRLFRKRNFGGSKLGVWAGNCLVTIVIITSSFSLIIASYLKNLFVGVILTSISVSVF